MTKSAQRRQIVMPEDLLCSAIGSAVSVLVTMGETDRDYGLTEAQKARKAKYPPVNKKYEYLDHTADVQLHAWGDTLEEAFEQCAMAMFGYMTDIETVEPIDTMEVEAEGDDMLSLLFHFLDEWLYKFCADQYFVPREVKVLQIDKRNYKIRSIGWGETFDLSKHPQGTEVKAITYSAMQIHEDPAPELFVIIDI
ncbi:protein archease isoform X1 [Protopterus annectens]|uniref:protein archease isoform X1 n=2 Tax=Protopterus annectens TaxID=7888 RepID=UPI001CF98DD6|nr:protein archease isoform X1 [Protopterus annectens]